MGRRGVEGLRPPIETPDPKTQSETFRKLPPGVLKVIKRMLASLRQNLGFRV